MHKRFRSRSRCLYCGSKKLQPECQVCSKCLRRLRQEAERPYRNPKVARVLRYIAREEARITRAAEEATAKYLQDKQGRIVLDRLGNDYDKGLVDMCRNFGYRKALVDIRAAIEEVFSS